MASSLLRIKHKFPINSITPYVLQKNPTANNLCSKWRYMMSISINQGTDIQDILTVREARQINRHHDTNVQMLKEKEKGDWRYLTLEEKKQLYQLSFNQPICETAPADEWKAILGGTFTAMGLITMGIYVWFTKFGLRSSFETVPSMTSEQFAEKHKLMVDFVNENIAVTNFESLSRS